MRDLIEQLQAETDRLVAFRRRAERLNAEIDRRDQTLAAARLELTELDEVLEGR
jgi:hypothetical protein